MGSLRLVSLLTLLTLPTSACGADRDRTPGDDAGQDATAPDGSAADGGDAAQDASAETGPPSTDNVGDSCEPRDVPDGGFLATNAYVEPGSESCDGNVCMAYLIDGDPRTDCNPADERCADPGEAAERIFCSCRCAADDAAGPFCECPSGFECVPVLPRGAAIAVQGSYCLRDGLAPGS